MTRFSSSSAVTVRRKTAIEVDTDADGGAVFGTIKVPYAALQALTARPGSANGSTTGVRQDKNRRLRKNQAQLLNITSLQFSHHQAFLGIVFRKS